MKKILIIGKRSFLGNSLLKLLKKKYKTNIIYYKNLNKFKNTINSYNYIINTSINKNYINKKYNEKFDNDLQISKILEGNKIRYVFFSTRKVYSANANIKENSKLSPKTNYSKNKLITENLLKSKFKKNLLILRISNIIGDKSKDKYTNYYLLENSSGYPIVHYDLPIIMTECELINRAIHIS